MQLNTEVDYSFVAPNFVLPPYWCNAQFCKRVHDSFAVKRASLLSTPFEFLMKVYI